MKKVHHIVLLKFKATASASVLANFFTALDRFRATIPGITHFTWGPYSSPEGINQGFTHGFIMTFRDSSCRDVYLTHPDHQKVKADIFPSVENVLAFDFEE